MYHDSPICIMTLQYVVQIFRGRYVVMADLGASTEAQCPNSEVQTFNSCTVNSSVTSHQAKKLQEVFFILFK